MALDPSRVHRILGERDDAEKQYVSTLEQAFGNGSIPVFDLILLGMGPDGHTASLFPHTSALDEKSAWVAKNWVEKLKTNRYTFSAPLINAAREVLITACGAEKAPVLKSIANDPEDPKEHPILLVRPTPGKLVWLVDKATGL